MRNSKTVKVLLLLTATATAQTAGGHGGVDHSGECKPPSGAFWSAPSEAQKRVNPVESTLASMGSGKRYFIALCSGCHGVSTNGDGPVSHLFGEDIPDLAMSALHHSDGDFFWKISKGRKGMMPGWGSILEDDQIWNMVNFIKSKKQKVDKKKKPC